MQSGKPIRPVSELESICRENRILMGITTVPSESAQQVCDELIRYGIKAIWSFAPVRLNVPDDVFVQYENMTASPAAKAVHCHRRGSVHGTAVAADAGGFPEKSPLVNHFARDADGDLLRRYGFDGSTDGRVNASDGILGNALFPQTGID